MTEFKRIIDIDDQQRELSLTKATNPLLTSPGFLRIKDLFIKSFEIALGVGQLALYSPSILCPRIENKEGELRPKYEVDPSCPHKGLWVLSVIPIAFIVVGGFIFMALQSILYIYDIIPPTYPQSEAVLLENADDTPPDAYFTVLRSELFNEDSEITIAELVGALANEHQLYPEFYNAEIISAEPLDVIGIQRDIPHCGSYRADSSGRLQWDGGTGGLL